MSTVEPVVGAEPEHEVPVEEGDHVPAAEQPTAPLPGVVPDSDAQASAEAGGAVNGAAAGGDVIEPLPRQPSDDAAANGALPVAADVHMSEDGAASARSNGGGDGSVQDAHQSAASASATGDHKEHSADDHAAAAPAADVVMDTTAAAAGAGAAPMSAAEEEQHLSEQLRALEAANAAAAAGDEKHVEPTAEAPAVAAVTVVVTAPTETIATPVQSGSVSSKYKQPAATPASGDVKIDPATGKPVVDPMELGTLFLNNRPKPTRIPYSDNPFAPIDDDGSFDSLFVVDKSILSPKTDEEKQRKEEIDRVRRKIEEDAGLNKAGTLSARNSGAVSGALGPDGLPIPMSQQLARAAQQMGHENAVQFERDALPEAINVVGMDLSAAQDLEVRLEKSRIEALQEDVRTAQKRFEDIARREAMARRQLESDHRLHRDELRHRHNRALKKLSVQMKDQQDAFRKIEEHLKVALQKQEGEVKTLIGEWKRDTVKSRTYKVNWSGAPRLVKMKINFLRAVKNKLPAGHYVMLVTLYDRLGGHPLRWSKLQPIAKAATSAATLEQQQKLLKEAHEKLLKKDEADAAEALKKKGGPAVKQAPGAKGMTPAEQAEWVARAERADAARVELERREHLLHSYTASTPVPQKHNGHFRTMEMSFGEPDNHLYILCPPKSLSRPSMVMVFELFCLPTPKHNLSRVLGWAAFPMCSPTFDVIEGKFKVPFLRGEVDPGVTLHSEIDDRIRRDLDNWLCNMYFDVEHLPRYMDNQSEYEVELDYTAQLLNMPNLRPTALSASTSNVDFRSIDENALAGGPGGAVGEDDAGGDRPGGDEESKNAKDGSRSGAPIVGADGKVGDDVKGFLRPQTGGASGGAAAAGGASDYTPLVPKKKSLSRGASHEAQPDAAAPAAGTTSAAGTRLSVTVVKKRDRPMRDTRQSGGGAVDEDDDDEETGGGGGFGINRATDAKRNKAKILRQYKFAVTNVVGDVPPDTKSQRVRFFFGEVVSDVSLNRWKTIEWWSMVLFAMIVFYFRFLIHYLGQYLYLSGIGVPITDFTATPYTVKLEYPTSSIDEVKECLVVIIGVLSNIALFIVMMAFARLTQRVLNKFPDSVSRFLLCYGVETLFDPLLIIIVDCATRNWSGDAFKLYNLWVESEGSGVAGVVFTVLIYSCTTVASIAVLYYYLLKVHMNGRMLDIHQRLHSDDDVWHIPDDMEISAEVLQYIISKSYKWRGFQGTKRQIAVTKYTVRDHLDPNFNEETVHLAIYNVTLTTGERDMYRHFVKYHDGSIRELFEAEDIASDEDYVALEEKLFNLLDEQDEKEQQQQLNDLKLQAIDQAKKDADAAAAGANTARARDAARAKSAALAAAASARSSMPEPGAGPRASAGSIDSKYGGTPVPAAASRLSEENARLLGADPAAADSAMQPIGNAPAASAAADVSIPVAGGGDADLEAAASAVAPDDSAPLLGNSGALGQIAE